jgi:hypothetical protein
VRAACLVPLPSYGTFGPYPHTARLAPTLIRHVLRRATGSSVLMQRSHVLLPQVFLDAVLRTRAAGDSPATHVFLGMAATDSTGTGEPDKQRSSPPIEGYKIAQQRGGRAQACTSDAGTDKGRNAHLTRDSSDSSGSGSCSSSSSSSSSSSLSNGALEHAVMPEASAAAEHIHSAGEAACSCVCTDACPHVLIRNAQCSGGMLDPDVWRPGYIDSHLEQPSSRNEYPRLDDFQSPGRNESTGMPLPEPAGLCY